MMSFSQMMDPCTGGVDEMVGGIMILYFQVFFMIWSGKECEMMSISQMMDLAWVLVDHMYWWSR
jgi:hypothetical protein